MFLDKMEGYNTTNLYTKFKQLPDEVRKDEELIKAMRHYDYTVNITWVMAHYHAAAKYIGSGEATGGSDWRKYMLPRYQRRIFFPEVWSDEEIENWGHNLQ
jgi:tryptophan 2,3-dioxygenase